MKFTAHNGSSQVLTKLALGNVDSCPFLENAILELKTAIMTELAQHALQLGRQADERTDCPIDFRYLELSCGHQAILKSGWVSIH